MTSETDLRLVSRGGLDIRLEVLADLNVQITCTTDRDDVVWDTCIESHDIQRLGEWLSTCHRIAEEAPAVHADTARLDWLANTKSMVRFGKYIAQVTRPDGRSACTYHAVPEVGEVAVVPIAEAVRRSIDSLMLEDAVCSVSI